MPETLTDAETREIAATFPDRAAFERAVNDLLAQGFERTDLSVLASHDSLEVAEPIAGYDREKGGELGAGLAGELGFVGSIGIAGALLLAGGPVGAVAAAVVAAGGGVIALRPFLARFIEEAHAGGFAQSVEDGRILLWVRTPNAAAVTRAEASLARNGGNSLTRLRQITRESTSL